MVTKFTENTANNSQNTAPITGIRGIAKNSYVAYADDSNGTGFLYPKTTAEFDDTKTHIAILNTYDIIEDPQASDFAGLWFPLVGGTGPAGPAGPAGAGYTVVVNPSSIAIPPSLASTSCNFYIYDSEGNDVTSSYSLDSTITNVGIVTATLSFNPGVFTILSVTDATGYRIISITDVSGTHPDLVIRFDYYRLYEADPAVYPLVRPGNILIPADNDGSNPVFLNASAELEVVKADGTSLNSFYTASVTSSSGISSYTLNKVINDITFAVTGMSGDSGWAEIELESSTPSYPDFTVKVYAYKVKEGPQGIQGNAGPSIVASPGDIAIPSTYDGIVTSFSEAEAHIIVTDYDGTNITDDYDTVSVTLNSGISSVSFTDESGYKLLKILGVTLDQGYCTANLGHPVSGSIAIKVNFHKAKAGFNGTNQPDDIYLGLNGSGLMTIKQFAETLVIGDASVVFHSDTGLNTGNIVIGDGNVITTRDNKGTLATLKAKGSNTQYLTTNEYSFIASSGSSAPSGAATSSVVSNKQSLVLLDEVSSDVRNNKSSVISYRNDLSDAFCDDNISSLVFADDLASTPTTTYVYNLDNSIVNVKTPQTHVTALNNSLVVGSYLHSNSGTGRLVVGRGHYQTDTSGDYNGIIGQGGRTLYDSEFVIGYASSGITTPSYNAGKDQTSKVVKRINTTDATKTTLLAIEPINNNVAISFKATITAHTNSNYYHRSEYVGLLKVTGGGTVQIVGSIQQIGTTIEDASFNGTVTLELDGGNNELQINVTGEAATDYSWMATVDIDRMGFPL